MPDDHRPRHFSEADVESLLVELRPDDLDFPDPPSSVWAAIEARSDAEPVTAIRRRRPTPLLLAAAAVAIVVSAAVMLAGTTDRTPTVVAVADLSHDATDFDPLGVDATASARLVAHDGALAIVVDDARFPELDADLALELWLLAADESGTVVDIVPVAFLDGPGTYEVPPGLDIDTHRVLDISVEPRDGDESHSGRSILRGTLTDA
ncbi:MAG: anti-sigma factor domain-containing protein [Ilumatobacteraceae bacterium]